MKEENWKKAVEKIAGHSYYSTTSIACEKALKQDTAQGYRDALQIAKNDGYLVNVLAAEKALKE